MNISLAAHDTRDKKTHGLGRCGASTARRLTTPLRQVTTHHRQRPISEHIRAKITVKSFLEMGRARISEKAQSALGASCYSAIFWLK
jgi:hypothetical protein